MRRRHMAELLLELEPDWHRVDPDIFAGHARQEELPAVFRVQERTERVRHLEPALVVDAGWGVTAEHETPQPLGHFYPQISTQDSRRGRPLSQRQKQARQLVTPNIRLSIACPKRGSDPCPTP